MTTIAKYDHVLWRVSPFNGLVPPPEILDLPRIILGDGGYCGTGYVAGHQLFKLYSLQGVEYLKVSVRRQILGGDIS